MSEFSWIVGHPAGVWSIGLWQRRKFSLHKLELGPKPKQATINLLPQLLQRPPNWSPCFKPCPATTTLNRVSRERKPFKTYSRSYDFSAQNQPVVSKHTFKIKSNFSMIPYRPFLACLFPPFWLPLQKLLTLPLALSVAPVLASLLFGGEYSNHIFVAWNALTSSYIPSGLFSKASFEESFPWPPNIK